MVTGVGADVHSVRDIDPDEPTNISFLLALDRTQASPQSLRLNDDAFKNIESMLTTLETSHLDISPLNNSFLVNMKLISVTLDTSHFERSPLKEFAPANKWFMSATLDTSHSAIGPCGPLEQSQHNLRHASTAFCSAPAGVGERAVASNSIYQDWWKGMMAVWGSMFIYIVFGRVHGRARFSARTIAGSRRHADKEHKE